MQIDQMWNHIVPINDIIEHNNGIVDEDYTCQCNPKYDLEHRIVIHSAMDRRECFESDANRLKRCPFCGSYDIEVEKSQIPVINTTQYKRQAVCGDCFATGAPMTTHNKAVEAWNTRYRMRGNDE